MKLDRSKQIIENSFKNIIDIFKENNVIIAGGLLTSLFTHQEVNDVDCYFRSEEDLINFLKDASDESAAVLSVTDKSMTLTGLEGLTIQLIRMGYFKDSFEVFDSFDWTINMCAYDFKDGEIYHHKDFFVDLASRSLVFNKKTAFPFVSAIRVGKYIERGYKISLSEMRKVLIEVSKLNITTREEFIKQVGGMYGVTALKIFKKGEKFDLDTALERLSNEMSTEASLWFDMGEREMPSPCSMDQLIKIMENTESVPYYIVDNDAYGKEGRLGDAMLYRIFKPEDEVDCPEFIESGVYYKWVREVNEEIVSIYDRRFKYEVGKEASDYKNGLYLLTLSGLKRHDFQRDATHILACTVDSSDFIKFDRNGLRSDEDPDKFAVTKLTPIKKYRKEDIDFLLPSAEIDFKKLKKALDTKEQNK